ncbi:MAG: PEGA domain-containing protein [Betaproteobacteria bacterium]|nr:PEGA domain-containing protein [Betaproteobacteria bacterium]
MRSGKMRTCAIIVLGLLVTGGHAPPVGAQPNAAAPRPAAAKVAVLDFHDSSGGAVKPNEVLYLSDKVRGSARRVLPAARFVLMTRDNISELLPEGRTLADCVGDCAVETGRRIGADYVATGEVTTFGGEIRVTVNLHETANGNLLGQVQAGSARLLDVEKELDQQVLSLLGPLGSGAAGAQGAVGAEQRLGGGAQAWAADGPAEEIVSFSSEPGGAMVEIDDRPVCETPCTQALVPGLYRIQVRRCAT